MNGNWNFWTPDSLRSICAILKDGKSKHIIEKLLIISKKITDLGYKTRCFSCLYNETENLIFIISESFDSMEKVNNDFSLILKTSDLDFMMDNLVTYFFAVRDSKYKNKKL